MLPEGPQLHALAAKLALALARTVVANSLLHLYASCGLPDAALTPAHTVVANSLLHLYASCSLPDAVLVLFRRIPTKSVVSWKTAVDALAGNSDHLNTFDLFREMQRGTSLAPDAYIVESVIGACAGAGALSLGVYAHALLLRQLGGHDDVSRDGLINNSLLDLYGKCGAVELARKVFDQMPKRDITSWNMAILTLANHGCVRESLELFDWMTWVENVVPNAITFVAVLSACNHGKMVEEGRRYFEMMVSECKIRPRIKHYGCMVDILARAGFIKEALDVVSGELPARCHHLEEPTRCMLQAECWVRA
uniref:Pentatricopeptide repeat-containing protein n=3 Tax=Aegilops tauschii TaxID=37682 RepID=A0A453ENK7_AEGTS